MRLTHCLASTAFVLLTTSAHGLTFRELLAAVPPPPPTTAAERPAAQELTVFLGSRTAAASGTTTASPPPPSTSLDVGERRQAVGSFRFERRPELSTDQLVVVGMDSSGANVAWSLARDPRLVRAELPGPDGVPRGQRFYRAGAELLAVLPDSPQIVRGAVYQPTWNGTDWQLTLIGTFAVGGTR
jgi:hypothetical protein